MNQELAKDLDDLLRRKRFGHMGRWEFSSPRDLTDPVNGIGLWKEFLRHHPEYYLPEEEKFIASQAATVLPSLIKEPLCLVSFGPGERESFRAKELELVSDFANVAHIVAVDAESQYIRSSLEAAKQARPEAILRGGAGDFFAPMELGCEGNTLASMFGGTLFNEEGHPDAGMPIKTTVARLKTVRENIGHGYFFLTVDHTQDGEKVERAYAGQEKFARNLVHLFNRDAGASFDYRRSGFRVEWHPRSSLLAHYLTIDGREYHFNNSYKMPRDVFLRCAGDAGFRKVYETGSGSLSGYLLSNI